MGNNLQYQIQITTPVSAITDLKVQPQNLNTIDFSYTP